MRPVDLDEFCSYAGSACQEASTGFQALLLTDDDDPNGVGCLGVSWASGPETTVAHADQLFAGHHDYAAMATMTRWSPDQTTDFADSWLVCVVHRGETARFMVNSPAGGNAWFSIAPTAIPWIAGSIAGSLRKALDGEPLTFHWGDDPLLFGAIVEGNPPPTQNDGKI